MEATTRALTCQACGYLALRVTTTDPVDAPIHGR